MRLGEHAVVVPVERPVAVEALLRQPGVVDAIVTETCAAIFFEDHPPNLSIADVPVPVGRDHVVRTRYDGLDLDAVGEQRIREMHASCTFAVTMLGFLPGFAYLRGGGLDLPRRDTPRARVPRRSVATAAGYTGIYPAASPGGWHLLGTAVGFDPFALRAGDRVRFEPTDEPPDPPPVFAHADGNVHLTRVVGPALLVDGGRPRMLHRAVPPGGPLVRGAFARANAAVGNAPDACGIEVHGAITVACDAHLADDEGRVATGSLTVAVDGARRVRYVAVEGGLDAPVTLGSRGALLTAEIGRPLRRGDRFQSGRDFGVTSTSPADDRVIVLDGDAVAGTYRIARASDRTGTRLEGGPFVPSAARGPSMPMVFGAIESTPTGLVVLGPDHPTTGGYPIVGVLAEASRDAFFACPIGGRVELVAGA